MNAYGASRRNWFVIWFVTAWAFPAVVIALAAVFSSPSRPPSLGYDPSGQMTAVNCVAFAALGHYFFGLLLLRGYRLYVLASLFVLMQVLFVAVLGAGIEISGYDL